MLGKVIGVEVRGSDKKDKDGNVIGHTDYKYLHVVFLEVKEGVNGTAVACMAVDPRFKFDEKSIEIGAEYELFTFYDSYSRSDKCNGFFLYK